jgi:predicted AAA+ superfamily ATPase
MYILCYPIEIMKRKIYSRLKNWKNSKTRKPLILQGARQVGKTYALNDFGKHNFSQCHFFDFFLNEELHLIFEKNLSPQRIIQDLEIFSNQKINLKTDLIIFDEIQLCPRALASLKYFAELDSNLYLCAAGSLLGLGLAPELFPVGKVEFLTLRPLSFLEFVEACGETMLSEGLQKKYKGDDFSHILHNKLSELLKIYFITGGLPEVITEFLKNKESLLEAFVVVRKIQNNILKSYYNDFAKHSGKMKAIHIESTFKSIPRQLARENKEVKKFVFKDVGNRLERYVDLEGPIQWLEKAGLVHKISICNRAQIPLASYTDERRFKLYLFDIGILGLMNNLSPHSIFQEKMSDYKGYFVENFVLQEMLAESEDVFHCWNEGKSEIEFLFESDKLGIIPIEVKAGKNTRSKSLSVYRDKYNPVISFLFSSLPMEEKNKLKMLPLYFAGNFKAYLD